MKRTERVTVNGVQSKISNKHQKHKNVGRKEEEQTKDNTLSATLYSLRRGKTSYGGYIHHLLSLSNHDRNTNPSTHTADKDKR